MENNRQAESNLPEEVRQYYAAEQRERKGMAWVLSAITVVVVLVVGIGGYYGARWTYRKLHHSASVASSTKPSAVKTESTSSGAAKTAVPPTDSAKTPSSTSGPATTGAPAQTNSTSPVTTQNNSSTTNSNSSDANSTNSALTSTGPGHIFTIFGLSSVFSTIAARSYFRHKLNQPE